MLGRSFNTWVETDWISSTVYFQIITVGVIVYTVLFVCLVLRECLSGGVGRHRQVHLRYLALDSFINLKSQKLMNLIINTGLKL